MIEQSHDEIAELWGFSLRAVRIAWRQACDAERQWGKVYAPKEDVFHDLLLYMHEHRDMLEKHADGVYSLSQRLHGVVYDHMVRSPYGPVKMPTVSLDELNDGREVM